MVDLQKNRREFMKFAAVIASTLGVASTSASAQEDEIVLEVTDDGWVGVHPDDIEGEVNPTLDLDEGVEYEFRITFGTADGNHNLVIVDENDNELVSSGTLDVHNQEEEFAVVPSMEMVSYLNGHAEEMRGDIVVHEVEPDPREDLIEQTDYALEGLTAGWEGLAPESIEGEQNPTLSFEAGEEYTVGWINGDGDAHNIAFRDAEGTVLASTEFLSEEGETQMITVEAVEEMVEYVCEPHVGTMVGDVEIEGIDPGDDGDDTDDNGDADDDHGDDGHVDDADDGDVDDVDDGDVDDVDDGDADDADDDGIPGFGIMTGLAGAAAGAAAAAKRFGGADEDEEQD